MKFTSRVTVTGMKASKGAMENGTAYDSTKVYVTTELDASKDQGAGSATAEYNFNKSDEFPKYKHLFVQGRAIEADVDFEQVTNGKSTKMIVHAVRPIAAVSAPASKG